MKHEDDLVEVLVPNGMEERGAFRAREVLTCDLIKQGLATAGEQITFSALLSGLKVITRHDALTLDHVSKMWTDKVSVIYEHVGVVGNIHYFRRM